MFKKILPLITVALLIIGCSTPTPTLPAAATPDQAPATKSLTVMTHSSFAMTEDLLKEFEKANNVKVQVLKSGDAGKMLNTALLNKAAPLADVIYGVDNTLLSRALDGGLFEKYDAPALKDVASDFKLDSQNSALPVDYGDVCLNYDKNYFESKKLDLPKSLKDLTDAKYKSLIVVEDPATSSTGLSFMLLTSKVLGAGFNDFWKAMRANEVKVAPDWEAAYYTDFSGSSGKGSRPLVVSYASSPPAEVFFAKTPPKDAPTGSIATANTCFRQIEFVGIASGAKNRELAQKWVDFMLSKKFQEDMPLNMFVYPVIANAALPEVFVKYSAKVESPVIMSADEIAKNREALIKTWTEIVVK